MADNIGDLAMRSLAACFLLVLLVSAGFDQLLSQNVSNQEYHGQLRRFDGLPFEEGVICGTSLICGRSYERVLTRQREFVLQISELKDSALFNMRTNENVELWQRQSLYCNDRLIMAFIFDNVTDLRLHCAWTGHGLEPGCVLAPEHVPGALEESPSSPFQVLLPDVVARRLVEARARLGCPENIDNVTPDELYLCRDRCTSLGLHPLLTPVLWVLFMGSLMVVLAEKRVRLRYWYSTKRRTAHIQCSTTDHHRHCRSYSNPAMINRINLFTFR
ncbi:unnamed protein product, partial [Mesorhabditis spiculigera]